MSPDEIIMLFIALGVAAWGWGKWYSTIATIWPPEQGTRNRLVLSLVPPVSLLMIYVVISTIAAFDVVGDAVYMFFYVALGLAWLVPGRGLLFMLGDLSWRDDAIERNNTAATYAVSGGILGLTAIYSGANVGDGPGWWVVVFTGVIATAIWFVLLLLLNRFSGILEKVTVERDYRAGVRVCGYMLASGIVLGRSAAGDWISAGRTLIEFWQAWPVVIVFAVALWGELSDKTSLRYDDAPRTAWLWAAVYVIVGLAALFFFPTLTQNPWYGGF